MAGLLTGLWLGQGQGCRHAEPAWPKGKGLGSRFMAVGAGWVYESQCQRPRTWPGLSAVSQRGNSVRQEEPRLTEAWMLEVASKPWGWVGGQRGNRRRRSQRQGRPRGWMPGECLSAGTSCCLVEILGCIRKTCHPSEEYGGLRPNQQGRGVAM